MNIIENCPLKGHNTFGIDATADVLIEFSSEKDLCDCLKELKKPVLTIGAGSNLLFLNDFHGTILHSAIKGIETVCENDEFVYLRAGSGVLWDDFVSYCVAHGLWGAENLSGIPGEVGASAVQNIGAYGAEVCNIIEEVRTVSMTDGSLHTFSNADCRYGYRDSVFKNELKGKFIVTYVTYRLKRLGEPNLGYGGLSRIVTSSGDMSLNGISAAVRSIRNSKLPDPSVLGNAGSFFMNPVISEAHFKTILEKYPDVPSYPACDGFRKVPAGWLIEQCGWKGKALGAAAVHKQQALILVNTGGASGADIKLLANTVSDSVEERFNIRLKAEVNFIE